jgi:OOP family OmpA-OmpF porin
MKPLLRRASCVVALLAGGTFAPAPSSAAPPRWIRREAPTRHMGEVGVFGGAFFPSRNHDFYDPITAPQKPLWAAGGDVGLRAAYFPLPFVGLEVEGVVMPTRARTATDDFALLWGVRAHPVLQLPWYRITPFVLAGAGAMGVRSSPFALGRDVDPVAHWGAGIKWFMTQWVALRVDGRHLMAAKAALQNDVTSHFELLAGISVTPRHRPKPSPPPDPDRDRDGFRNENDACPDRAGVAPDGCPARDGDADGFLDPQDRCPQEKGVAPDGCPIPDRDGDGILDAQDECPEVPETKNGFEDDDGCPDELPKAVERFNGVIEGIVFELDSDVIRPESKPVLDEAAGVLRRYTEVRVEISGHTDDTGTREHNLDLSRRRAEAVRRYLVGAGIDAGRLETRGAGPDEPLVPNVDDTARAKNRRTQFKVLHGPRSEGDRPPPPQGLPPPER